MNREVKQWLPSLQDKSFVRERRTTRINCNPPSNTLCITFKIKRNVQLLDTRQDEDSVKMRHYFAFSLMSERTIVYLAPKRYYAVSLKRSDLYFLYSTPLMNDQWINYILSSHNPSEWQFVVRSLPKRKIEWKNSRWHIFVLAPILVYLLHYDVYSQYKCEHLSVRPRHLSLDRTVALLAKKC